MAASAKQYTKMIVPGNRLRVSGIQGFTDDEVSLFSSNGVNTVSVGNTSVNILSNVGIDLNSSIVTPSLLSYANDAAAQAGGVEVDELYINSGTGAVTRRLV